MKYFQFVTLSVAIFFLSLPFSFPFSESVPIWVAAKAFSLNYFLLWYFIKEDKIDKKQLLAIHLTTPLIVFGIYAFVNYPTFGIGLIPIFSLILIGSLMSYFTASQKRFYISYALLLIICLVTTQYLLPVFVENFKPFFE
jgi:hypothetical protein